MMTWWRKGLDVGFHLMTIGYLINDFSKAKLVTKKYPDIDGFPKNLSLDIKKLPVEEHDCLEEQLWAMRQGLA